MIIEKWMKRVMKVILCDVKHARSCSLTLEMLISVALAIINISVLVALLPMAKGGT